MRRRLLIAAGVVSLLAPTASWGQVQTDPDAESPAGSQYQIPLDGARSDGAPSGGTRDGSGSTGESGSAGRGGSGGSPPGGSGGSGGAAESGGGQAGEPSGGAADRPRSRVHSENGFGSSSLVPGAREDGRSGSGDGSGAAAGAASAGDAYGEGEASATDGGGVLAGSDNLREAPSNAGTYALLAALLLVGVISGLSVARAHRAS
jgi:hypothetical protein